MKGTPKTKVVTSGRLTGGVKGQPARRRVTPNQRPAACPEPAYSLYSSDPEDQVTSLHKGLDRCAALLSGILQAEIAEAVPAPPRAVKGGAAKPGPSTSRGKKTIKNTKTDLKRSQSVQRRPGPGPGPGPGSTTPRTTRQSPVPAAHSGVKLHPPRKQLHLPPPTSQILQHLPLHNPLIQLQTSIPPHQTSILPAQHQTSIPPQQASILPAQHQTFIPPPQTSTPPHQTSILLAQHQTSIPPPQTSIPPPQTSIPPPQISIPPPQTSIPPPQTSIPPHQTSIHPPQTSIPPHQTSIPPPQTSIPPHQTSIHPPRTSIPCHQTSIPPPQTSIPPPQTSIPPHQTSIHPPQTSIPSHQTSIPPPQTSIPPPQTPIPPHQTSIPPPFLQTDCQKECDGDEEEFVPVRDISSQSPAADRHSHTHTCPLEPGQPDNVPLDTPSREDSSAETGVKMRTVQYLLGELKALIAGQGSVAERLLSHLEQTVSSPLMDVGGSTSRTEPDSASLHSQNTQLRRRVRMLNQQLKEREKAEKQQNMEALCNSEVSALQEELTSTQTRLQELQVDLTGLRKALQDTQNQLADRKAENTLIKTELEATRSRLLDSEREKSEMASLAQQRLEEKGNLSRILQSCNLSNCLTAVDTPPTKQHLNEQQRRQDPAEPPMDRISRFLMSLGRLEPTHTEHERKLTAVQLSDASSHPDVRCQRGDRPADSDRQSHNSDEVQSCEGESRRLSQCESVRSDWSVRSESTFDTRDEAAFRDGLAALDASIASLQKTMQLDLGR